MSFENPTSEPEGKSEKQRRWNEVQEKLKRITDGLGMEIDKGIVETVVALNAHEIPTEASCEGHLEEGHGNAYPWVDIAAPGKPDIQYQHEEEVFQEIAQRHGVSLEELKKQTPREIYFEALQKAAENPETEEFRQWKEQSRTIARKLQTFLDEFYANREVKPVVRLSIGDIDKEFEGDIRLQSGSHMTWRRMMETPMRKAAAEKLLPRYQAEMAAFTEFLKKKFFET